MNRGLLVLFVVCAAWGAAADDLNFSAAAGKRLKTEVSPSGVPSLDQKTWTATCNKGIAIAGYCESQSGARQLQSVGAVVGTQWACTWTEPTPKAEITAVCLFEEWAPETAALFKLRHDRVLHERAARRCRTRGPARWRRG